MAIFSVFRVRYHFRSWILPIIFHIVFFVISNKEGKLLKRGINKAKLTDTVSGKVSGHVSSLEMTEIPVKLMQETIFFQIRGCDLGSPNAEKITFSE